ncbi:MAG: hypothetical protein ACK559_36855, partial [bacterium]
GHTTAVAPMHQQGQQEQQHPHRAGIETIQQTQGDGEQRQSQSVHLQGSKWPQPHHTRRAQLTSLLATFVQAAIQQVQQLLAAAGRTVKSDQHRVTEHEGRHPRHLDPGLGRDPP